MKKMKESKAQQAIKDAIEINKIIVENKLYELTMADGLKEPYNKYVKPLRNSFSKKYGSSPNILIQNILKESITYFETILGMNFSYEEQKNPNGIAEAFIIGEKFIGNDSVCLILGDNMFYGSGFTKILKKSVEDVEKNKKAKVFGYYVNNPSRYGVVENDKNGNVISLEEKPKNPKSNYAVVGLYFYPNHVIETAKNIKPSNRGELEITSINNSFLKNKSLIVELFDKNFTWLDSGTHESMLEASNYIHTIEKRTGLKIACIEEIAYKLGYINKKKLNDIIDNIGDNQYGDYLKKIKDGI